MTGGGACDPREALLPITIAQYQVGFYQTDAMGIMHHSNYVHVLERARVQWLEEHDEPYRNYVAQDLHFAVTRVDVRYVRAARFDDRIETLVWVDWVRGASLAIRYELRCDGAVIAKAMTEHALVDERGRPKRIPAEKRARLAERALGSDVPGRAGLPEASGTR